MESAASTMSASNGGHAPGRNTSPRDAFADFRKLHLPASVSASTICEQMGMHAPIDVLCALARDLPAHALPDAASDLPVGVDAEDPDH